MKKCLQWIVAGDCAARKFHRIGGVLLGMFLAVVVMSSTVGAAVHVAVTASPDPARPGEMLDVKITVTNDGPFAAANVVVEMEYPAGLASMPNGHFDGTCPSISCVPGNIATFNIPSLAAGKAITYHIAPFVSSSTRNGTEIPFDVDVLIGGKVEASASAMVTVNGDRALNLAMVEHRNPVSPGDELTYSLTYGIPMTSGGSAGAVLTLPLPAGTSLVSASDGGTLVNGAVEWALGNLSPGAVGRRTVTLEVDSRMSAGSIIIADAFLDDLSGAEVAYSTATAVSVEHPLEITITASPDPVRQNQTQDVQITITNTGFFDRTGVQLRIEYPNLLTSLSNGNFDGTCPSISCLAQERAFFDIGTLPAGKGRTFVLPIRVSNSTPNASVITVQGHVRDGTGDRRLSGSAMVVSDARTLELAVTADRNPVRPGDRLTYTLNYGVLATGTGVVGTTISLPLPHGMTFIEASGNGTLVSDSVEWTIGNLNVGTVGQKTLTVEVDSGLGAGTILRTEAQFRDIGANRVSYEVATFVQPENALEIMIVASPNPARQTNVQHFQVYVTNTSVFDRSDVVLRVEYSDHHTSLSNTMFDGTCPSISCLVQERATFNIGTLPAGKGKVFNMPVQVTNATSDGTVVRFTGYVRDGTGDMRRSSVGYAVRGARTVDLGMTASHDPVAPGATLHYDINYGVVQSGIVGASLSFPVPHGTSFVSASDGGVLNDGIVEWTLGNLNAGKGDRVRVTVQVDSSAMIGSIIAAEATFRDSGVNVVRFQAATRVQQAVPLTLTVTASPNPAGQGETVYYEMTVSNNDIFDRSNVVLRMEYPTGLTTLSNTDIPGGSCQSISCVPENTAVFNLGTIPAGRGRTMIMQLNAAGSMADGRVITMLADVSDGSGDLSRAGGTLLVDGSRTLDLALRGSNEPIVAGGTITYTMAFGTFLDSGGSPGTALRFMPPPGVTITTISPGGVAVGDVVEWDLGTLDPGAGGDRTVQVLVDPGTPPGTVLAASAWIDDSQASTNRVHYDETTRIETSTPLDFEVLISPCVAGPGSMLSVLLSVTNTTDLARAGVEILVEFPDGFNSLSNTSFPGSCQSISCVPQNQAFFNIGTVEAGETLTFLMPPVIANSTQPGTVISFKGYAQDAAGFQSRDKDSMVVTADFDPAYGADLNGNGSVGVADLLILLSEWGLCFEPDKCPADLNCDGSVGVADLLILLSNWG